MTDWAAWHDPYDDPDSPLSQRLAAVQAQIRPVLDRAPQQPLRLLSLCAGRGLDVLPVLADHRRGRDVTGRLVELDERNCARARELAPPDVEVVQGDAGSTDACLGAAPADLLLLCGIFGNMADADVERTVRAAPALCAAGGTMIWTRSRHAPDLTPAIRRWAAEVGFTETGFVSEGPGGWAVGSAVLTGDPQPLVGGQRLFRFSTRPPR
jgi:hypothetical protein